MLPTQERRAILFGTVHQEEPVGKQDVSLGGFCFVAGYCGEAGRRCLSGGMGSHTTSMRLEQLRYIGRMDGRGERGLGDLRGGVCGGRLLGRPWYMCGYRVGR